MCLSIPSRVVKIDKDAQSCTVDTMGVQRDASLMMMADGSVGLGDFVLIHIGFVMNTISKEEAELSLQTYQELLEVMDEEERKEAILEGDACNNGAK